MIRYSRIIKKGTSGTDVMSVKSFLFIMGFYPENITRITHNKCGNDTVKAIKNFQEKYGLVVDGLCGKDTLSYINALMFITTKDNNGISLETLATIFKDLQVTDDIRADLCIEALTECVEPLIAKNGVLPKSLYIRGGNLYNTDLKKNIITLDSLVTYKKRYSGYCTNGRYDFMKSVVEKNPNVSGADCSGGLVGLFRKFSLKDKKFDTTANSMLGTGYSKSTSKSKLEPADFCGKPGHIGLYVGGGYCVEWAGGEYGCQLSGDSKRKLWSYTKKKYRTLSSWNKWRKPTFYG